MQGTPLPVGVSSVCWVTPTWEFSLLASRLHFKCGFCLLISPSLDLLIKWKLLFQVVMNKMRMGKYLKMGQDLALGPRGLLFLSLNCLSILVWPASFILSLGVEQGCQRPTLTTRSRVAACSSYLLTLFFVFCFSFLPEYLLYLACSCLVFVDLINYSIS